MPHNSTSPSTGPKKYPNEVVGAWEEGRIVCPCCGNTWSDLMELYDVKILDCDECGESLDLQWEHSVSIQATAYPVAATPSQEGK